MVGANPPYLIMNSFLRRIWANKGIDKVVVISKGVFLVRFHNLTDCDSVFADGFQFFDRKQLLKNGTQTWISRKMILKLCLV